MTKLVKCIKDVPVHSSRHLFYFYEGKTYTGYERDGELLVWDEQGNSHGIKDGNEDAWFDRFFVEVDTVDNLTEEEKHQFHINHTQSKIKETKREINILETDCLAVSHPKSKESIQERIDELNKSLVQLTAKLLDLHINE